MIVCRSSGTNCFSAGSSLSMPRKLRTRSLSPVMKTAGTMTFAPAHGASSSQLRSVLRYQLSPPRNPVRGNSPAYTSTSTSVSHAGSVAGTSRRPTKPPPRGTMPTLPAPAASALPRPSPEPHAEPIGPHQRRVPRDGRAPIVAGDDRGGGAERVEQSDEIADEMQQRVGLDRVRPIGVAIAALVG